MRRYQRDIAQDLPQVNLLDDYFGPGYGVATEAGKTATAQFETQGIKLEPTYTAKAAAAALDYCDRHQEETVLYWHTFNSVEVN